MAAFLFTSSRNRLMELDGRTKLLRTTCVTRQRLKSGSHFVGRSKIWKPCSNFDSVTWRTAGYFRTISMKRSVWIDFNLNCFGIIQMRDRCWAFIGWKCPLIEFKSQCVGYLSIAFWMIYNFGFGFKLIEWNVWSKISKNVSSALLQISLVGWF